MRMFVISTSKEGSVAELIEEVLIKPRITRLVGDERRVLRWRIHDNKLYIHILNRELKAITHPFAKSEYSNTDVLGRIESDCQEDKYAYEVELYGLEISFAEAFLLSPKTEDTKQPVRIERMSDDKIRICFDLKCIKIYGVIQQ